MADESYGQSQAMPADQPQSEPTPAASNPTTTDTMMTAQTPVSTPPPAPTPLTDEQIFAVLDAANTKEIEEAKAIEAKTKNKDVKAFAKMMIQHHTDAKNKGTKLAQKLKVTPAEFDKSRELREDTTKQVEQLKAAQATDMDKAFIDLMVQDHKAVLDTIDKTLMADAKAPELKAHLTEIRPVVEKHLKDAEAIQTKLAAAPGATPAGGKAPATGPGAPSTQPGTQPGTQPNNGQPGATKSPGTAPGAGATTAKPGKTSSATP